MVERVERWEFHEEGCEHNSTSCSAYTSKVVSALTYSDNRLYWVESEISEVENDDGAFKYKYDYTVWCRDIESGAKAELSTISNLDYSYIVGFYKGSVILISGGSVYKADVSSGEMSRLCDITFLEGSDYKLYAETNAGRLNVILVYYTTDYEAEEVTYTIQKSTIDLDSGEELLKIEIPDYEELSDAGSILVEMHRDGNFLITATRSNTDSITQQGWLLTVSEETGESTLHSCNAVSLWVK